MDSCEERPAPDDCGVQMYPMQFAIRYGHRKIPYFNVTCHPTADWVAQQLREAFREAVKRAELSRPRISDRRRTAAGPG